MQSSAGVAERMAEVGKRAIRDHLIDQHRQFFPLLPFVVLGAVDPAGNAWATLRGGRPGFMRAASPHRLSIRIPRDPGDPADAGMEDGDGLGLLGIDLFTRRRNRLNGPVSRNDDEGFDLVVEQSYGNCPKYIQMREFSFTRDPAKPSAEPSIPQEAADDRVRALIQSADTLFVASYVARQSGHRQVDVSHRGGKPGFARIGPDGVITIPDFAGNLFFNTLGNFLVNPKGGLAFPDWETGDLLQLTGDVEVILDSPEIKDFQGAERFWRFKPHQILYRPDALPLRWAASPVIIDAAPHAEAYVRITARAARLVAIPVQPSPLRSVGDRQVRSGLPAGGNGIRNLGPTVNGTAAERAPVAIAVSRKELSLDTRPSVVQNLPSATHGRPFARGGTEGSNPPSSSGESDANATFGPSPPETAT
ncbi:MAG TPA: pyridoxamine 5'-phosphate oxidase family protein [Rhizomicrobium sp.]|nr:pyridoxamine 5'-phosphate oxidase family protein [Rhizomicrobium sp.]